MSYLQAMKSPREQHIGYFFRMICPKYEMSSTGMPVAMAYIMTMIQPPHVAKFGGAVMTHPDTKKQSVQSVHCKAELQNFEAHPEGNRQSGQYRAYVAKQNHTASLDIMRGRDSHLVQSVSCTAKSHNLSGIHQKNAKKGVYHGIKWANRTAEQENTPGMWTQRAHVRMHRTPCTAEEKEDHPNAPLSLRVLVYTRKHVGMCVSVCHSIPPTAEAKNDQPMRHLPWVPLAVVNISVVFAPT